jgi:hypothetical protein
MTMLQSTNDDLFPLQDWEVRSAMRDNPRMSIEEIAADLGATVAEVEEVLWGDYKQAEAA